MSETTPTTETTSKPNSGLSWGACFLILLTILVGYVLSPGPLTWLGAHGYISPSMMTALEIFFFPLRLLYETYPMCRQFFDWYFRFWM